MFRQFYSNLRPCTFLAFDVYASAAVRYDAVNDRKAEPRAVCSGLKRFVNILQIIRFDPASVVGKSEPDVASRGLIDLDGNLPALGRRVNRILLP